MAKSYEISKALIAKAFQCVKENGGSAGMPLHTGSLDIFLRLDNGSRMNREVHVRFCEGLGVQLSRSTHPYVWTDEGWFYLAGVMDLCGRTIVGFSMADHMRKSLVINALNQAIGRTKVGEGPLVHSDRGVQHASHTYQEVLKKNGFTCSVSRRGNCWDNAPMESFWGKLKQEWLYTNRFRTRDEAKTAIFEYIEIFYNRQRKHSSNHYKVPMDFMNVA